MPELAERDGFYLIVGGAAGALIGLQFVVMTLIAERPPARAAEAGAAFATPTIVHFSTVLLVAALVRAAWHSVMPMAALLGLTGLAGLVYCAIVVGRMRAQTTYRPEFEDWLFHVLLPLVAYALLALSAALALPDTDEALFGVGGAMLLLFTGIHNAWDAVSYHVLSDARSGKD